MCVCVCVCVCDIRKNTICFFLIIMSTCLLHSVRYRCSNKSYYWSLVYIVGGIVAVIGGTCCYVTCAQGIGLAAVSIAGQCAINQQSSNRALAPTATR